MIDVQASVRRNERAAATQVVAGAAQRLPGEIRRTGPGVGLGKQAPVLPRLVSPGDPNSPVDPVLLPGDLLRLDGKIDIQIPVARSHQPIYPAPRPTEEGV